MEKSWARLASAADRESRTTRLLPPEQRPSSFTRKLERRNTMASNRGVAYVGPGEVEVKSIDYPKLKMPASETNPFGGKDAPHGVILKIVTTNICGSDQHMVRGRTTAPRGLILGHEITGEVVEKGNDEDQRPDAVVRHFPDRLPRRSKSGVGPGTIVYVAGAGPVGLACAASCHLLGAAVVIVGDMIDERLRQAKSFGCEVIDLKKSASLADQIAQIVGVPEVDAAVDCVGFEARGHGSDASVEKPATVLNSIMEITRAGGQLGIPGLYVTGDPGGVDANAKIGNLGIRIGLGWAKSHSFHTGQCPVLRYNRQLMQAILHDKIQIAKAVNAQLITLDEAPKGYKDFDKGAAKKFVIDPHGTAKKAGA